MDLGEEHYVAMDLGKEHYQHGFWQGALSGHGRWQGILCGHGPGRKTSAWILARNVICTDLGEDAKETDGLYSYYAK